MSAPRIGDHESGGEEADGDDCNQAADRGCADVDQPRETKTSIRIASQKPRRRTHRSTYAGWPDDLQSAARTADRGAWALQAAEARHSDRNDGWNARADGSVEV